MICMNIICGDNHWIFGSIFRYINQTVKLFLPVALCAFQKDRISRFGGKLQKHMVGNTMALVRYLAAPSSETDLPSHLTSSSS